MFSTINRFFLTAGLLLNLPAIANTQESATAPPDKEINQAFQNQTLERRDSIKPWKSLEHWKEKSFVGNTRYELHNESGTSVLRATAVNSASVLYRQEAVDLASTPWLEWSWKIESTYNGIDEKTKTGDDFPARLYVTAQKGFLPWESIAINYVWSSHSPIGSFWFSPYTKNSIMVAVQGGNSLAGQWVNQRRNIAEDFKDLFNIDVKKLSGFAVMVDGDNSSQSGTAYFGNIDFVAN